jgi:gamma-glutamyltranspeptidase/glutathione hydrolase
LSTIDALKADGYVTRREGESDANASGTWGDSELIAVDPKTGVLTAGQDHRHHFGKASGY